MLTSFCYRIICGVAFCLLGLSVGVAAYPPQAGFSTQAQPTPGWLGSTPPALQLVKNFRQPTLQRSHSPSTSAHWLATPDAGTISTTSSSQTIPNVVDVRVSPTCDQSSASPQTKTIGTIPAPAFTVVVKTLNLLLVSSSSSKYQLLLFGSSSAPRAPPCQ
ncbi:MAG: hypothetical protein HY774_01985 [Acidobacteria bacterium]|nr:hypothetical protein [Acidobacteriota bacterium]